LTCCRRTRFSASSVALALKREARIPRISLNRSVIRMRLEEFAGQALFVGPTAYVQLSERSRLTIAWSVQAWGRAAGSTAALDLANFERHQARLIFGFNF
jgi:hypothetical protein